MALGLTSWLINGVFVTALTYVGHSMLRGNRRSLNAAEFSFLWIFTVTLFMLVVGLVGWLKPLPILAVSLAGLALLGLWPASRGRLNHFWPDLQDLWKGVGAWWASLPRWLRCLTLVAAVLSVIRFCFLIIVFPPFVWDALTYHLTNVAHWTQAGRIELFDTPVIRIYTPANYETFATWFTVFLHHDLVVEAAGLPAYALGMLAVYATARELGMSGKASYLASLTYAFMPAFLMSVTATKNDPHMAAYFMTCLAILAGLLSDRSRSSDSNVLGQLVLLGVVWLYAFGTKAYMLHLTPALLLMAVLGIWWRHQPRLWLDRLHMAARQLRAGSIGLWLFLGAVMAAALFLGGYWNVRNWALTGNPFFPYGVALGGSQVLASGDRTAQLNLGRLLGNFQSLVSKFGDKKAPIIPDLSGTTGWGWFVYSLGLPALAWSLWRRPRGRLLTVVFLAGLVGIFMSDRPSPWNMRYVIWFPALFSLAFADWVDSLPPPNQRVERAYAALMIFALVMNFAMTLNYNVIPPGKFQLMLEQGFWDRQAATLKVNMPAEYENALVYVPDDALLGYNVGSNGFIYPLYRADFSQHLVYVPLSPRDSCQDVIEAMQERHTRYLFVAPEHTADANIALLQKCSETNSGLRQRARGIYVIKNQP